MTAFTPEQEDCIREIIAEVLSARASAGKITVEAPRTSPLLKAADEYVMRRHPKSHLNSGESDA